MEFDIIEEVLDGFLGWILFLVVVFKGDGDIRVCVDMWCVNEVIICERYLILMVEEFLYDLNGSIVFSKIDFKWGFY